MNALELVPTARDPALRALLERGLAQARAREATAAVEAAPEPVETAPRAAPPARPSPRSLGLASDRACVESNLARKGLWRSGTSAGGELVRLLDATDQLGIVQRIDAGPPLGALAFDVIVWACSRWREVGAAERHVPFTLEAMATDLGWRKGGGAALELAGALDALRQATFRARVYNARVAETRIDTFGLIDRWERGEGQRARRSARPGFIVLGDWLHEQLVRGHVTYVSWAEMRELGSATARRLLVYLDAERFSGMVLRRVVDAPLLTTLGITASRAHHQRATLRRAAADITGARNRYVRVGVAPGEARGEHCLVAERTSQRPVGRRAGRRSSSDRSGQSAR
jgi:hypothetical protein